MAGSNLMDKPNSDLFFITEENVPLAYRRQFEDLEWDTNDYGVEGRRRGEDEAVSVGVAGAWQLRGPVRCQEGVLP